MSRYQLGTNEFLTTLTTTTLQQSELQRMIASAILTLPEKEAVEEIDILEFDDPDFVTETKTSINNKKPTIVLQDKEIIALSEKIEISYPGLPHFSCAINLIQKPGIDFAKRKLYAIRPPLLQTVSHTFGDLQETQNAQNDINNWHKYYRVIDELDVALADTAYYFDKEHNRLIIRHTINDATSEEKIKKSLNLINQVTEIILENLKFHNILNINHIIPQIDPPATSFNSNHIVLHLYSEKYISNTKKMVFIGEKKFTSGINILNWDYYSLCEQKITNNTDCGWYVAVMATIAAQLFYENKHTNANDFCKADFRQFPALKLENCNTTKQLKELLCEIPSQKRIPPSSFVNSIVGFFYSDTSNSSSSESLDTQNTSLQHSSPESESEQRILYQKVISFE